MIPKLLQHLTYLACAGLCAQAYAINTSQTGDVHITGKLVESSCALDSSSPSFEVALPALEKSSLALAQSTAGRTGFIIKIVGCADGVKVSASFYPGNTVDANGNLKNAAQGGASNVQVQLLDKNGALINIQTDQADLQFDRAVTVSGSTPAILQFYAQYYSPTGNAGAGNVGAIAHFQLSYE